MAAAVSVDPEVVAAARNEEISVLQSLFCSAGEFTFHSAPTSRLQRDVASAGALAVTSIAGSASAPAATATGAGFDLRISLDSTHTLLLSVVLPSTYPSRDGSVLPVVSANRHPTDQSEWLSSPHTVALNTIIQQQLKAKPDAGAEADPCRVVALTSWINENSSDLLKQFATAQPLLAAEQKIAAVVDTRFVREWIVFHHMYSSHKRKTVIDTGVRLGCTGLVMTGKPGLVIVEGIVHSQVQPFLAVVRGLSWQKMSTKLQQFTAIEPTAAAAASTASDPALAHRKWSTFREHESAAGAGGGGQHADVSGVMRVLTPLGLSDAAREALGLAAPSNAKSADDKPATANAATPPADSKSKPQATATASPTASAASGKPNHKSNNKKSAEAKSAPAASAPASYVWLAASPNGDVLLTSTVQPNAKQTRITSLSGEAVEIRLNAPPRDGEANDELCRFLTQILPSAKKKSVSILKGHKNRTKTVLIAADAAGGGVSFVASAMHKQFLTDSAAT